ncbi:MAG: hypothetical protein LBT46_05105 [Planctomycetaceae bacterium]|jgi:hypothetical protein|nr:hypothetical protein [Planctomycetaceae bacterium]
MSIKIEIPQEKIDSPSSVLKLSGMVVDADGNHLAVPSTTDHVEWRFAERVMQSNGNTVTIPEDTTHFHVLDPAEYYFYDNLQPAVTGIATKPYTFLFQPDKNRRPFFPQPGIFEVHFRFIPKNDENDVVELLFICFVGGVAYPRKI